MKRLIGKSALTQTINRIVDYLPRLQIQNTPTVSADITPRGTSLRITQRTDKPLILARHFVGQYTTGSGDDEQTFAVLTLHVPQNLLLPSSSATYDNRPQQWEIIKTFTGSSPDELTPLEENISQTFNQASPATVENGIVTYTFEVEQFTEENPFANLSASTFSLWQQSASIEETQTIFNPLWENDEGQQFVRMPFWAGFTAPFIDAEQSKMGWPLTGTRLDILATVKIRAFAGQSLFQNAITGQLDSDCSPVDNTLPRRFYSYIRSANGSTTIGGSGWVVAINEPGNPATTQTSIIRPGIYTDELLIPTKTSTGEWSEMAQRIRASEIVAQGEIDYDWGTEKGFFWDTQIDIPILRCLKNQDAWEFIWFNGAPPNSDVAWGDFIDQATQNPDPLVYSNLLSATVELRLKALQNRQNCSFDPDKPESPSNRTQVPFYEAGWQILPRTIGGAHDRFEAIIEQTCNETDYAVYTITEQNDETWHIEQDDPLDSDRPPETLFFLSGAGPTGRIANPGVQAVTQYHPPEPTPC